MAKRVVLSRFGLNKSSDKVLQGQLDYIKKRALSGNRGRTWTITQTPNGFHRQKNNDGHWTNVCTLTFNKTSGSHSTEEKQWKAIFHNLIRSAKSTKFGKYPWLPIEGTTYPEDYNTIEDEPIRDQVKTIKDYGKLSLKKGSHFDHLYDRDPHIDRMMAALETAVATDFQKRYHVVLYGPPGCGKTDILLSAGKMMGKENEAYFKFDATSTTQAMALDILLKSEYIPPVLLVEEIEKTDEKKFTMAIRIT
jgi:chromosomal replication initiation ATPase DnaA